MVYDARREAEYLALAQTGGRPQRLGFMGFSLGAKAAVYVAAFAPELQSDRRARSAYRGQRQHQLV